MNNEEKINFLKENYDVIAKKLLIMMLLLEY